MARGDSARPFVCALELEPALYIRWGGTVEAANVARCLPIAPRVQVGRRLEFEAAPFQLSARSSLGRHLGAYSESTPSGEQPGAPAGEPIYVEGSLCLMDNKEESPAQRAAFAVGQVTA